MVKTEKELTEMVYNDFINAFQRASLITTFECLEYKCHYIVKLKDDKTYNCVYLAKHEKNKMEAFFISDSHEIILTNIKDVILIEEMTFLQKIKFKLNYIKYLFQ